MPEGLTRESVPAIAKTRGKADIVAKAMELCRMVVAQTGDPAKREANRVSRASETIRKTVRRTFENMATRYLNAKLVTAIRSKCTPRPFLARSHKVRWDGIVRTSSQVCKSLCFTSGVELWTIDFHCDVLLGHALRRVHDTCDNTLYFVPRVSPPVLGPVEPIMIPKSFGAGGNFHLPERRAAFLHSVAQGDHIPVGHTEPSNSSSG